MVERGLDCLRTCLLECLESDKWATTVTDKRDGDVCCAIFRCFPRYLAFLQALHDTTRRIVPLLNPLMVLDVSFATMILSMIRSILYNSKSSRVILGPKERVDGYFTTESEWRVYLPVMVVLEISNKTFYELCDDTHLMDPSHPWNLRVVQLPISKLHRLAGELRQYIDRVEPMLGLAEIGLGERAIAEDKA